MRRCGAGGAAGRRCTCSSTAREHSTSMSKNVQLLGRSAKDGATPRSASLHVSQPHARRARRLTSMSRPTPGGGHASPLAAASRAHSSSVRKRTWAGSAAMSRPPLPPPTPPPLLLAAAPLPLEVVQIAPSGAAASLTRALHATGSPGLPRRSHSQSSRSLPRVLFACRKASNMDSRSSSRPASVRRALRNSQRSHECKSK